MNTEKATIAWEGGTVSAQWNHPAKGKGKTCLVLAHGAGGTMHTPALTSFATELAARGIGVLRFNFPYAETRRKAPDPQPRLESCYRSVADYAAARTNCLFLGGRSMGGRIASHIVADGVPTAGLVFLSYPLHPPGKPERIRDAHLPSIKAPMLFFQGTRDTFARPDLLTATLKQLPHATLHVVEGANHGLSVPNRPPADVTTELAAATTTWIQSLT